MTEALDAHQFPRKTGVKVIGRDARREFFVPVLLGQVQGFAEGDLRQLPSSLVGPLAPGVVDEDSSHRIRGCLVKVRARLPVPHRNVAAQAHPGLVHQGRGLERVVEALAIHAILGDATQLAVDDVGQLSLGPVLTAGHLAEQTRDVKGLFGVHVWVIFWIWLSRIGDLAALSGV